MMNKTTTWVIIGVLGSLAILIILFLFFALFNKNILLFKNYETTLLVKETYSDRPENIQIESVSSNVYIREAIDNQIHVEIYGLQKEQAESTFNNNTLFITNKENRFCFGFCFSKKEIYVFLPKDIITNLDIKTISGDVKMDSFSNVYLKGKTTSGDLKIGHIKDAKINTTSGNIEIDSIGNLEGKTTSGDIKSGSISNKLNIESVSGDIKIQDFLMKENSYIKTVSGDVTILNGENMYIEASTTSGDVDTKANDRFAEKTLKIKTTSGDITVQ